MNQNTKINILVLFFFSLITLIITWPLILNLGNFILDPYDAVLINWIINWNIFHPLSLNTNIFFPYTKTLAYSDPHLVSSLVAAPFVLFFKQPLLGANINLLLGFVLTAFSTYLLTKNLTKDYKISLLAGTLFAFGSIHMGYLHHLQLFGFWPFIFALYFFYKEKLTLFVIFFVLSVATMPLFFFFFMAFFIFAPKKHIKYVFLSFGLSLLIFVPYYLVSKEFGYVRPLTDTIHFSLKIHDFFKPNEASRLGIFAGIGTLILLIGYLFQKNKLNRYFLLSICCFILAFGPAFHVFENTVHVGPLPAIPMPYLIPYYLLPGFSGFRTPSRWILLAFFAFVIALSIVLKNKLAKKITALLVIIIILEVNFPFTYINMPSHSEFPPEQIWLEQNYQGAPIVQFPIYGWFDNENVAVETRRMHYGITQNHPMFNGYSGFSPKSWERRVQWLQKEFPNENSINYLKSLGIKLIVTPKVLKSNQVKLIESFPNNNIYAL